ncbi:uncharacterized protein LOC129145999 isoform X9 [Talpa occidentalis]|uniref:uncharacterized protein LOC129145999 isoform X9 n=1 Tax=Talpa occidentalis TaxID=50954 RepID=UPI0023F8A9C8|nr:uncharacterized protein LOC129145999 isoform X9 [Talpa occidentalis]
MHSYQPWRRFTIGPYPCQHLELSIFWIMAILMASEAKRIAYQDYLLDCFLNQFFSSPHSTVLTSLNNDPMEDIPILAHNVLKAIEDSLASGYASTSRLTQLSRHFFKWSCLKHTERKKRLFKTVKREKAESDQKRTAPTWLQSPLASLRNWYKSL